MKDDDEIERRTRELSPGAAATLLSFTVGVAQPYPEVPFTPRLELFRAGLLIGGDTVPYKYQRVAGCHLHPLGIAVAQYIREQDHEG